MALDAAIKEKWVADLLSGEHEQGDGSLLKVNKDGKKKWCCLGRLCDLVDSSKWTLPEFDPEEEWAEIDFEEAGYDEWDMSFPSVAVYEATGLEKGQAEMLANLNDGGYFKDLGAEHATNHVPQTFPEIAEYIKANL